MWNDAAHIQTQAVKLQASNIAIVLSEYFTGYLGNAANEPSEREKGSPGSSAQFPSLMSIFRLHLLSPY